MTISDYLKLSLWGSCHNHHPHFGVWRFSWCDLKEIQEIHYSNLSVWFDQI